MAFPVSGMDAAMDFCMLAAAQLCISRLNLRRLALAWLLLAVCTLCFRSCRPIWFLHMPVLLLCAAVATGERSPRRIAEAAVCMFCASAAAAGACLLGSSAMPAAVSGCMLTTALLRSRRHLHHRWNIEVRIFIADMDCSIPVLIDTGNRLREQKSGMPVLIAEESAVSALCSVMDRLDESALRSVPYGVLGGHGSLKCFRPDRLEILLPGRGAIEAPPCWVAVFPGRIPGCTRALAPPEFAEAIDEYGVYERVRRFNDYGFFKRSAIHLWARSADSQGIGMLHRRK